MSGFGEESKSPKITVNLSEVAKLTKKYKKLKKYMKSPMYEIKTLSGTETVITNLLKELESDESVD
jgi:5-bromo-4-chloroindolyl phosphate hydrolysis protein